MTVDLFDQARHLQCEEFHVRVDPISGLQAIIAIHNTNRGPALGGCRLKSYDSFEQAALDALRLARGMSLKSALANLPLGGGKTVILKPPHLNWDRVTLFKKLGQFIHTLGGRYITAVDVGVDVPDMDTIYSQTPFVSCTSRRSEEEEGPSDPSPMTALGVLYGMKAACQFLFRSDSLQGRRIAIQGLGHVGHVVARLCREAGAELILCDSQRDLARYYATLFKAQLCEPEDFFDQVCDILSPCALGGILNEHSIPRICAPIIAGAANNPLALEEQHGRQLFERHIVYVPDYALNAGGVIQIAAQHFGQPHTLARAQTAGIYSTVLNILERSRAEGLPTQAIAQILALEKMQKKESKSA